MRLFLVTVAIATILLAHGPVRGQSGPCATIAGPSILVKVTGLKNRSGKVRIRLFGGDPKTYFDKKHALKRIEFVTPKSGGIEQCIAVPRSGSYAVDVRHDANNDGKTDRSDGAGASGNPDVSLQDVIFKKKPPVKKVQIGVGSGTTVATIIVKYLSGGKFKPI